MKVCIASPNAFERGKVRPSPDDRDHIGARASLRRGVRRNVQCRAVCDAARFGKHRRHERPQFSEEFPAPARVEFNRGDDVDHDWVGVQSRDLGPLSNVPTTV